MPKGKAISMLPEAEFAFVSREVRLRSGLVLTPDKAYLLETRLSPIMRKEGFGSLKELIVSARSRRDEKLLWAITDALTTNETFFFRDKTPFDLFKDAVAPHLLKSRGPSPRVRILCAACSTGQEPYSLAMLLEDMRDAGQPIQAEIVGVDISDRVLEKAKAGLYSQFEVQRGLPARLLVKHFEKVNDMWRISDRLRAAVRFQRFNLLEDIRSLGRFDVVFCRNVLIYFDQPTKKTTLEKLAGSMPDDGFLLLGAAETMMGVTDAFEGVPDFRGLYRRNTRWRASAAA
jgi:chemotaxis protein methyltransferase CheR